MGQETDKRISGKVYIGFGIATLLILIIVAISLLSQTYVKHYNKGNEYFRKAAYEQAISEYEKALKQKLPKEKECLVRINMALSLVTPLDEKTVEKDPDAAIETLEQARDILLAKECATDDDDGHNDDAQQLKNEIDEYLEQLKNGSEGGEPDPDDPHDGGDPQPEQPETDEIREALQNLQQQGVSEYVQELESLYFLGTYEFDMGASW